MSQSHPQSTAETRPVQGRSHSATEAMLCTCAGSGSGRGDGAHMLPSMLNTRRGGGGQDYVFRCDQY